MVRRFEETGLIVRDAMWHPLGFREDEKGANVWLVVPDDEGVFHGSEVREGIRCEPAKYRIRTCFLPVTRW